MLLRNLPTLWVLLLVLVSEAVRLIREEGFKPGSHFYHLGDHSYAYHVNIRLPKAIYFKCAIYERLRCHGRAILRDNGEFTETQAHNHPADPDFVGLRHFRQNVLRRIRPDNRHMNYQEIVEAERRDRRYSRRVRVHMNPNRLRNAIARRRGKMYPPIPHTLEDLSRVLRQHPRISKTVDGDENLYAGSVTATDGSHHVAFFSPKMLAHLARCPTIQGDGTFRSRPQFPRSSQVFVIVTTWNDCVVPMGWFLMENRKYVAYRAVFELLKQLCPNMNPQIIISDWEANQQRAWAEAFPNAQIQGCLWHLGRAYVKKAKKLNIVKYFKLIPDCVTLMRKVTAVSLLPSHLFEYALQLLRTAAQQDSPIAAMILWPFFDYVQEKWYSNAYRKSWMAFFNAVHRTNNSCETHNKMLRRSTVPTFTPSSKHWPDWSTLPI